MLVEVFYLVVCISWSFHGCRICCLKPMIHRSTFLAQQMLNESGTCWKVVATCWILIQLMSSNICAFWRELWNCARRNVITALRCKHCRCNYETSEKRRKNRKTWTPEWLKNRTFFGAYYTLLAELRDHVFWSRVGLSTNINTFSNFRFNTAAVLVALLDLPTKPRDIKLENDCSTSFNKRQPVERNRLKLYSVQQRSTAVEHVAWLFQHSI